MDFSLQEKKYEEKTALILDELSKQGIPTPVFEKVIQIIDEFEVKNSETIDETRTAFYIVLLAKAYNEGRMQGINEEQAKKAGVHK